MTERLSSTAASGESTTWVPAGTADMILQFTADGDISQLQIELQTRLDATAPWVGVQTINLVEAAMISSLHLPIAKLVWRGNKGTLKAWDSQ